MNYFKDFELKDFSLISESNKVKGMIDNATKKQADSENYGCGCFWFVKKYYERY